MPKKSSELYLVVMPEDVRAMAKDWPLRFYWCSSKARARLYAVARAEELDGTDIGLEPPVIKLYAVSIPPASPLKKLLYVAHHGCPDVVEDYFEVMATAEIDIRTGRWLNGRRYFN